MKAEGVPEDGQERDGVGHGGDGGSDSREKGLREGSGRGPEETQID